MHILEIYRMYYSSLVALSFQYLRHQLVVTDISVKRVLKSYKPYVSSRFGCEEITEREYTTYMGSTTEYIGSHKEEIDNLRYQLVAMHPLGIFF